jgi:hypothetical protein
MLKATGKGEKDYLLDSDFEKFPCADLRTIDRLWTHYSDGRFGFSVQKRIYEEEGKNYLKLAKRVGWFVGGNWLSYAALTWHEAAARTAPEGHLPVNMAGSWKVGPNGILETKHVILLSRTQTSKLLDSPSKTTLEYPIKATASAIALRQPPKPEPNVEVRSEKGVDYTRLHDLLAAGKWKEADEETAMLMVKAAGQERRGYIDEEDIKNFPCTDLRTLDQLWVKFSDGHFGFSVQKRIWESIGGQPGRHDYQIFQQFRNCVGWNADHKGLHNSNLIQNAPQGYLPYFVGGGIAGWGWLLGGVWTVFSRIETCEA